MYHVGRERRRSLDVNDEKYKRLPDSQRASIARDRELSRAGLPLTPLPVYDRNSARPKPPTASAATSDALTAGAADASGAIDVLRFGTASSAQLDDLGQWHAGAGELRFDRSMGRGAHARQTASMGRGGRGEGGMRARDSLLAYDVQLEACNRSHDPNVRRRGGATPDILEAMFGTRGTLPPRESSCALLDTPEVIMPECGSDMRLGEIVQRAEATTTEHATERGIYRGDDDTGELPRHAPYVHSSPRQPTLCPPPPNLMEAMAPTVAVCTSAAERCEVAMLAAVEAKRALQQSAEACERACESLTRREQNLEPTLRGFAHAVTEVQVGLTGTRELCASMDREQRRTWLAVEELRVAHEMNAHILTRVERSVLRLLGGEASTSHGSEDVPPIERRMIDHGYEPATDVDGGKHQGLHLPTLWLRRGASGGGYTAVLSSNSAIPPHFARHRHRYATPRWKPPWSICSTASSTPRVRYHR